MAIASSGAVSFSDLRTEFVGGSAAISYSDLYRGGSNIRTKASNNFATNLAASVPTTGNPINIANFRGQAKGFRITYGTGAAAANYQNQNAAVLFGDDYAVNYPKEIVIGSGVELGATSTSDEALEIPSGGAGLITVTNNGTISGAGGAAGAAGGDAFEAAVAVTLINNGLIRAGGGGGGTGGQGSYPSYSTPYWSGLYRWMSYHTGASSNAGNRQVAQWAGQYVVNQYTSALSIGQYSRSSAVTFSGSFWQYRITKTTTNYQSGGAGGVGQGYNQSSGSGSSAPNNAGAGGSGGSFGQAGGGGVAGNYTNGVGGGAAGNYIRGLSFVTLTQSGTVQGNTA